MIRHEGREYGTAAEIAARRYDQAMSPIEFAAEIIDWWSRTLSDMARGFWNGVDWLWP